MSRKSSSGIKRGELKQLKAMAKNGTMPYSIIHPTDESAVKAYEMINRYYGMPSEEYLKKTGIRMEDSWSAEERRTSTARGFIGTGEYDLVKMVSTRRGNYVSRVPIMSSFEARQGALKFTLYHALRLDNKLDKQEFMRKKK